MTVKLTEAKVEAMRPGQKLSDSVVPGFFVRLQKGGKQKVFAYRYRMHGKDRTFTIGRHDNQPDF